MVSDPLVLRKRLGGNENEAKYSTVKNISCYDSIPWSLFGIFVNYIFFFYSLLVSLVFFIYFPTFSFSFELLFAITLLKFDILFSWFPFLSIPDFMYIHLSSFLFFFISFFSLFRISLFFFLLFLNFILYSRNFTSLLFLVLLTNVPLCS